MIHQIFQKSADQEIISNSINSVKNSAKVVNDFSDVIVKKPWGYEYLAFENKFVAIWFLQLVRKRKTSMHCHPQKKTSLVSLTGEATFYYLDGKVTLNQLDGVVINQGAFHSTEASSELPISPASENGIWIMEIESPPQKEDLMRVKDEYGREGVSYEGQYQMVFKPRDCIKFQIPKKGEVFRKDFLDCEFTIQQGGFNLENVSPFWETLISIIGKNSRAKSKINCLEIGGMTSLNQFLEYTKNEDLGGYTILTIQKTPSKMRLSDYLASFVAEIGVTDVFSVTGGGSMHMVDSFGSFEKINFVPTHHEQAAAYAAEGYARISGKPGVAVLTTGPGGTNAISGVYGAWVDSIPIIFLAGQVQRHQMIGNTGLRQYGVQESDMVSLVKSITKYSAVVDDPNMIKYHLQKALHFATSGRPGPVWLDVPLDVQGKIISVPELTSFIPDMEEEKHTFTAPSSSVEQCLDMLLSASRPILISGYGIRLAKGQKEFNDLVEKLHIPVVSSWTSSDLMDTGHKDYVGRSGIFGERAGNFCVQNSDLLLVIGSRLSIPQIGYNSAAFAREAKKIIVDIDQAELKKPSISPDLAIQSDARVFMVKLLELIEAKGLASLDIDTWRARCREWKKKYPVVLPEYKDQTDFVNSFYFIDVLASKLDESAVICTDMGTSFTCTMQVFKVKKGQRLFTSSGHAPMGFGLPGTIGACYANGRKKSICISGDGGLQMNIQELQTIVHNKLPILLFVLNNGGYLTIKHTQQSHFGRYFGAESSSGLSCPDIIKVGQAYGIATERIHNHDELHAKIDKVLSQPGPFICEIMMDETQPLNPRISSIKKPDGTIVSQPLENLYPFLDRKEFEENMIVKLLEGLNQ